MSGSKPVKGSIQQGETLRRIVENISSELDLRRLLTQIVESACELLRADDGSIGLVDSDADLVRIEATHKMPVKELGSEWLRGVGLAGRVLESQQPIVLERYGELGADDIPGVQDNAVIGVPIFWREKMTGFFGIGAKKGRRFSPEDVTQLEHLARHAAIAIENARLFTENERSIVRTSHVLQATERIGNAMSVGEVIHAYLAQVAANGRYTCTLVLYEFDDQGNKVGNIVRGRWSPGDKVELMEYRVPTKRDFLDPILAAGKTVRIANALTDPGVPKSLREEQRRDRRPAVALVPLMADRLRIGLVILSDPKPHEWTDDELMPFQTTAAQLASALAIRRDHDALIESGRKLAVMEERRKIARDLHDSVTQVLFSLNLLAQTLEPGQVPPNEIVERINSLSRRGLQEMRTLLEELRPVHSQPKILSLGQRISSYAATVVGLPEYMLVDTSYQGSPANVEEQLLGIAQEALNNIAKHANAKHVRVVLQSIGASVKLRVEDDGMGLKRESKNKRRSGLGLTSMKERATEIGAEFCVETAAGQGTTIEAFWEEDAK
ncbi:MAG: GAF domain-containing sensor histidine kinase [Chlorobia bacterium]|nr:GAF domain-containing sensor histidine kinase [Fimbriimonadaceae bacterium]